MVFLAVAVAVIHCLASTAALERVVLGTGGVPVGAGLGCHCEVLAWWVVDDRLW